MKHYQVQFKPDGLAAKIHEGATLLEAAGQVGIILSTPCGNAGRCGKCKVRLLPSEKEVLACQYIVKQDLNVLIPKSSRFYKYRSFVPSCLKKFHLKLSFKMAFLKIYQSCHYIRKMVLPLS
ncbi:MAG: 2Fe-2S iron-sulfur cluster-binding protein [Planctomycetota bacterium]